MSSEERVKAEPCASAFIGCLVDGDAATTARERKIKRRAIVISVALQTMGLAALVIAPLFARPAELTERIVMPVPPYRHQAAVRRVNPEPQAVPPRGPCFVCAINSRPPIGRPDSTTTQNINETAEGGIDLPGGGPDSSQIAIFGGGPQPKRPDDPPPPTKRMVVGHIEPAMLMRRIEPVYPALARQTRRSGKVELHALIATDGTVQSLQVVSGDPLFVSSALEAVKQWRFKPTYLNGNPMEVDTYITVIYTLQQ
jgi:protein TonB